MMPLPAAAAAKVANPPRAPGMAAIAILSQNLVLGPIFGSFGVLLGPQAERMGVSTQQAALGLSLVFVSSSLLASPVGVLMSRLSLRWLMMLGTVLAALAFAVLGLTTGFPLFLVAYALLLGPAMALAGMIGPSTLVTRWFRSNGGLVQGLVYLPVVVAITPLLTNAIVNRYGVAATYLVLAAMIAVVLLPLTLLIRDHPPGEPVAVATGPGVVPDSADAMTTGQFLSQPRFWALTQATAAITGCAVTLSALLVEIAKGWDLDSGQAALLITIMSTVGMAGSVLFGSVADRLGGAKTLMILTGVTAVLWVLLAQPLPYTALVVVIALSGLCAAGAIPNLSRALAEFYGAANFSRAFGLATTVSLPLNVAIVPLVPWIRALTGSYVPAMLAIAALLAFAFLLAFYASRGAAARPPIAAIA